MKSRRLASLALVAVTAVGATTGCSMISTQATEIQYNAADGVQADVGVLQIRDALIVANEDGTLGNFAAAIVNPTDESARLTIEFENGSNERVNVPAGETVTLGRQDTDALLVSPLDAPAGSTVEVYFSSGDAEGVLTLVPVLDGYPYYEDLVPADED